MALREPGSNAKSICLIRLAIAVAAAGAIAAPAQAAICKYLDADGNIVYSNVPPAKGMRKLSCDIVEESARRAPEKNARAATPAGFPHVEPEVQKSRDDMRRKILDDELAKEQKLLTAAQQDYGNGAPQPLAEEKNDAEKYRQRIERLRQSVVLHQRNIDALRREIAATH